MSESLLTVIFYFYRSLFSYLTNSSKNKALFLAGHCLVNKPSFRLKEESKKDPLIGLRIYKRVIGKLFTEQPLVKIFNPENKIAVLAGNPAYQGMIVEYVENLNKEKIGFFIIKENIFSGGTVFSKILSSFIITFFSIPFIIASLFSGKRANLAITISEMVENAGILRFIKQNKIKEFHDFIPFEKDSNILAVILISKGVSVNKIPSSGPLAGHNKILIANSVTVSSVYHLEEIEHFKETFLVETIRRGMSKNCFSFIHHYINKPKDTPANTIGFYSTGSWIRNANQALGSVVPGSNDELPLIETLNQYLLKNRDYKLVLFLHPKEKNPIENCIEHYKKLFQTDFTIGNMDQLSVETFAKVDLGIGIYSTVLFERLFCGFKVILFPKNMENFPLPQSTLSNICVKDEKQLEVKISDSLKLSRVAFLEKNQLKEYEFFGATEDLTLQK